MAEKTKETTPMKTEYVFVSFGVDTSGPYSVYDIRSTLNSYCKLGELVQGEGKALILGVREIHYSTSVQESFNMLFQEIKKTTIGPQVLHATVCVPTWGNTLLFT